MFHEIHDPFSWKLLFVSLNSQPSTWSSGIFLLSPPSEKSKVLRCVQGQSRQIQYHRLKVSSTGCTCTNTAMIDRFSAPSHERQTTESVINKCNPSDMISHYYIFTLFTWEMSSFVPCFLCPILGITSSKDFNEMENESILQFQAGSMNGMQHATRKMAKYRHRFKWWQIISTSSAIPLTWIDYLEQSYWTTLHWLWRTQPKR